MDFPKTIKEKLVKRLISKGWDEQSAYDAADDLIDIYLEEVELKEVKKKVTEVKLENV